MDSKLLGLLERARSVQLTNDDLIEQRINMAAANGAMADSRITVDTVRATRTIMEKAGEVNPEMHVQDC